ncbi:pseudouridine synthase [Corynebacterium sp.]|uniref:pseudouridine synthase n=1 Tax=Corynebacterium sp. TaxID=1720 RepID=UPI0026DA715E|nr:pseudouridine synthase [Corynebacterium sp.]MDO5076676.1 pseudouridine synthase [Corynebacterium sp.]
MVERVVRRRQPPLPVRDGLNPSRAQLPSDAQPMLARDFLLHLILTQTHRHPNDDAAAVDRRFARDEVRNPQGRPYAADDVMSPGACMWFYRTPGPERPVPHEIPIIYSDSYILVADKPPFLATMPRGRHITETATVRLRRATGNQDLSPAHRLDRLTSGVLVFTQRPEFRRPYQELFAHRQVHKVYEALAPYSPDIAPGTVWEHRIEKTPGALQAVLVDGPANARTRVLKVEPLPNTDLARYTLAPETGRTHQLRLHMAHAGVPILGDPLYPTPSHSAEEDFTQPMRLLARELSFTDPIDGAPRVFRSPRRHTPLSCE